MKSYFFAGVLIFCSSILAKSSIDQKLTDTDPPMEFIIIKATSFIMGSEKLYDHLKDDERAHKVTISKDFEIGNTVVTQKQYTQIMGSNPSFFTCKPVNKKQPKTCTPSNSWCPDSYMEIKGHAVCPDLPVERVSWNDIQGEEGFLAKLNSSSERYTFSLPTEAQWELAARAKTTTEYWYGNDRSILGKYAHFEGNSKASLENLYLTFPVKSKPPNQYGVYGTLGNVGEWVFDIYRADYEYLDPVDPVNTTPVACPAGVCRVLRGGSSWRTPEYCRLAYRGHEGPNLRHSSVGFRVVRTKK